MGAKASVAIAIAPRSLAIVFRRGVVVKERAEGCGAGGRGGGSECRGQRHLTSFLIAVGFCIASSPDPRPPR